RHCYEEARDSSAEGVFQSWWRRGDCSLSNRIRERSSTAEEAPLGAHPPGRNLGTSIGTPDLCVLRSLGVAGPFRRAVSDDLLPALWNPEGSKKRLLDLRSRAPGLSECRREA